MKNGSKESFPTNPQTPAPTRMDSDVVLTPAGSNESLLREGWGQGLSPAQPTQLFPDGMGLGDSQAGSKAPQQPPVEELTEQTPKEGEVVETQKVAETPKETQDEDRRRKEEPEEPPPSAPAPDLAKAAPTPAPAKAAPIRMNPSAKQKAPAKILYQHGSYWRTSST